MLYIDSRCSVEKIFEDIQSHLAWVKTNPEQALAKIAKAQEIIKQRLLAVPTQPKIVTINAWNEWPEGSCLEPTTQYGYGYLRAIKAVFSGPK